MIIESRSYTLHPGRLPEYLGLFEREEGVMERLGPFLKGFWFAESGVLNTVHHLWTYESRATRAAARAAMAADPAMQRFMVKVLPMLYLQRSRLMSGDMGAGRPDDRGGVYDRIGLRFRADASPASTDHLLTSLREVLQKHYEVVACLRGSLLESGAEAIDALFVLRSPSFDERDRNAATVEPMLKAIEGRSLLAEWSGELILPAPFSPWR